jgi:hypothetical protein
MGIGLLNFQRQNLAAQSPTGSSRAGHHRAGRALYRRNSGVAKRIESRNETNQPTEPS